MRKKRVIQIRVDNHRFKDKRGNWITDFKGANAPATDSQKKTLFDLGCKLDQTTDIKFHVANQLISKLKRRKCTGSKSVAGERIQEQKAAGSSPAQQVASGIISSLPFDARP